MSCAVSAANLRCWLAESCLRRSSVSCAVSAANLRCWLAESCLRRSSLVLDAPLSPVQCRLLSYAAGCQRVCLRRSSLSCAVSVANLRCWLAESCLSLSPVQSRLLTCAASVVDAPVSDRIVVATRSWGGVYVIAGFTECSRRKLLRAPTTYDITYIYHDTAAQL